MQWIVVDDNYLDYLRNNVEGIDIITDEECEKIRQDIIKREEERIRTNYYTGKEIMSMEEINAEIDAYRKGL